MEQSPKVSITNGNHSPDIVRQLKAWGSALLFCFLVGFWFLFFISLRNPLFWDSILLSGQYGLFYLVHWGKELFVPQEMAGYPPLWGYYLATCWKVFGKSLAVSHLAMLPFLGLFGFEVRKACQRWINPQWKNWVLVLVLLEPTWLAQSTQVAPDLALLAFFWVVLNDQAEGGSWRAPFFLSLLMLLSPRGLLVGFGLILFGISSGKSEKKAFVPTFISLYLAPLALATFWYLVHKLHFGWAGFNTSNDWGGLFSFVSIKGFLKNLVVLAWRFLDQGRILVFGLGILLFWLNRKWIQTDKTLLRLLVCLSISLFPAFLLFQNGVGHRYLLPFTTVLLLMVGQVLSQLNIRQAVLAFSFCFVALLSGHLWIYPEPIAKGWDATLAHLPYFQLKKEAVAYLSDAKPSTIGSDFPNLRPPLEENLDGSAQTIFKPKILRTDNRILYSNVFNGFSEADLDTLKLDFSIEKQWQSGRVNMVLYQRK